VGAEIFAGLVEIMKEQVAALFEVGGVMLEIEVGACDGVVAIDEEEVDAAEVGEAGGKVMRGALPGFDFLRRRRGWSCSGRNCSIRGTSPRESEYIFALASSPKQLNGSMAITRPLRSPLARQYVLLPFHEPISTIVASGPRRGGGLEERRQPRAGKGTRGFPYRNGW